MSKLSEEEAQKQYASKWHAAFIHAADILTILSILVTALTFQLPMFRLNESAL
jgi:hypothetical protein